ncbi:anaphase promoting complex subunit cdc26 [Mactra antiquata]
MLRRNPTRIELKLIDIEKEYEVMKKERENQQNMASTSTDTPTTSKTKTDLIHERIGYDPKPKISSTKCHIVN